MKRKILPCVFLIASLLILTFSADKSYITDKDCSFPILRTTVGTIEENPDILPESAADMKESFLPKVSADTDAKCFTYEELPDGTLRITGYVESLNTSNPYQVTIPAFLDGKPVSTLGKGCLGSEASFTWNLTELTISEGITTLEPELLEHVTYDLCLVHIPDSVISIAENAFQDRNSDSHDNVSIAIGCTETSYAYEYALKNGLACQILNPKLPENNFLKKYPESSTGLPYFCHYRMPGEMYDYIIMEYLDMEIEKKLMGEIIYTDRNEFMVLVLEKDSEEIHQCIGSSDLDPEYVNFSMLNGVFYDTFLSFADWNFDGTCDLLCYQGYFGTGAATFCSLFVYDADSTYYVYVPELGMIDTPRLREDKKCIYGFSRGAANIHYVSRYEYINGSLCKVAQLTEAGAEGGGLEIIDERLIDGEWQIYRQETFFPQNPLADGTYADTDAYEQAEILFVNDGYWDL